MTTTRSNVDDILTGYQAPPEAPEKAESQPEASQEIPEREIESTPKTENGENKQEQVPEDEKVSESDTVESKLSAEIDDYGNPTQKSRMYTEEEVNRMIRERLSRGQQNQSNQQQQQVQQAADGFQVDPNSTDSWEVQLEAFVKHTMDKVNRETQTKAWQEKERQVQADFEARFTTGMNKYNDFKEVVGSAPVTDAIMMAARSMKDPAAFVYAAAKTQGEHLKTIAQMTDPFQQAAEIGRLEERMRKSAAVTQAPRPLSTTKGDMPANYEPKLSIDDRIHQYAKVKKR